MVDSARALPGDSDVGSADQIPVRANAVGLFEAENRRGTVSSLIVVQQTQGRPQTADPAGGFRLGPIRDTELLLEHPSIAFGRWGMSGPHCHHLPLECRFEMLERAGRSLARESGEVVHHVHLVVVAEAMGDLGP
jgi:hypothetical protein